MSDILTLAREVSVTRAELSIFRAKIDKIVERLLLPELPQDATREQRRAILVKANAEYDIVEPLARAADALAKDLEVAFRQIGTVESYTGASGAPAPGILTQASAGSAVLSAQKLLSLAKSLGY